MKKSKVKFSDNGVGGLHRNISPVFEPKFPLFLPTRRWNITSRPISIYEDDTEMSTVTCNPVLEKLPLNVINNYFSLGADAATALEFHESRGK